MGDDFKCYRVDPIGIFYETFTVQVEEFEAAIQRQFNGKKL